MSILKALLLASALALTAHPASACMKDTAAFEIAGGRLAVGQAKDAAGRPESFYYLALRVPVCLTAADPADSVKSTRAIHIFGSTPAVHAALKPLVGKTIQVRGRVFPAHTSHHHRPIVMEILDIDGR